MTRICPALFVLIVLLVGCGSEEQAPDFSLKTHTGSTFQLSDHTGSVVVVNFWATWCKPCRDEIPDFVDLQDEYGDQGLQFVGVSLDKKGFEVVRPFAEEMNINYPLVVDEEELAQAYGGVPAIPTTFIVGKNGRIRDYIVGQASKPELRRIVKQLLEESPPTAASTTDHTVHDH